MRNASIDTVWRSLLRKRHTIKLENIIIQELSNFSNQLIQFNGSITALCGLNGIGKSTLLNSIFALISSINYESEESVKDDGNNDLYKNILFNENTLISGKFKVGLDIVDLDLSSSDFKPSDREKAKEIKASWIDTSYQIPNLIKKFNEVGDIDNLLDGNDPALLSSKELTDINYILGKDYCNCEIYEVELNDKILPYFRVSDDRITYGTEMMGNGELAALYIYWKFKSGAPGTIFLLEEPETYLSTSSQFKLMNVIAHFSDKKNFTIILTTHSSSILTMIPPKDIKLFIEDRLKKDVSLIDIKYRKEYMRLLDLDPKKKGIMLVEDRVASILLKKWLIKRDNSLLFDYEVVICNSKSEIEVMLKLFPVNISWFKIYGIFDGDQKAEISTDLRNQFAFLPGDISFELECQRLVNTYPEKFIEKFNVDNYELNTTLAIIQGQDPHDWFINLSEYLNIGFDSFIKGLLEIGIDFDEDFSEKEEEAFKELKKVFNII